MIHSPKVFHNCFLTLESNPQKENQPLAFDFLTIFSFGYPRLTQVAHKWLSFNVFLNPKNLSPKGTNILPRAPSFGSPRFTYWSFEPHPKTLNFYYLNTLKVSSFGFHKIHQAYPTNGSKDAYIVFRSRQNCIMICLNRTTIKPGHNIVLQPYPKWCHDLAFKSTLFCQKIMPRFSNRVTVSLFQNSPILSHYQQYLN